MWPNELSGYMNSRLWVGFATVMSELGLEASDSGVGRWLERPAAEEFLPVETRDLRARRSTCKGRGWEEWFMQRTGLVGVVSVAGVARGRAVRRRAWFRRRPDSSRVSESGWRTMKSPKQLSSLRRPGVGSRAAEE
jgi:hypothetical protein